VTDGASSAEGGSSAASTGGGGDSTPRVFRHGASSFEGKFDALLARRLFLANVLGCCIGGFALAASVATYFITDDFRRLPFFDSTRTAIVVFLACAGSLVLLLRRGKLASKTLFAVDAAGLALGALGPIWIYGATYENGPGWCLHFTIIAVFARAVFVPSRASRTFVLSAAAPLAWLALELAHGEIWFATDVRAAHFPAHVVWNQVVLWLCVALAAYASHANYALRIEAYQATRVGQYELEEKIGEGAMGEVWRARHGLLRRPTAVKLIRGEIVDAKTRKRFEHEVRQTCRLSHPNVVAIYDYGHTDDGVFFYAMELVDGEDLGRIVAREGPLPPGRVIHVLAQACEALAEAHATSLVHRDVKAANLMVCRRGLAHDVVKVMDFGLVKDMRTDDPDLAGTGEICGTPETISPEAARGRDVGPAADVYAIGAVGCFLLTGAQVFDATTAIEMVVAHMSRPPIRPSLRVADVPADLEEVLLSCLEKDPTKRPESATALRDALLACRDAGRWTQADAARWWDGRRAAPARAAAGEAA
jgi:serine/threonine-protein kinase